MSGNDDFRVEVSNGYLLIAVKIPTTICAACGVIWTPPITPEQAQHLLDFSKMPIDAVFISPWCSEPRWAFINVDGRRELVCATCAAPFTEVQRIGEAKACEAMRQIYKKIDARAGR